MRDAGRRDRDLVEGDGRVGRELGGGDGERERRGEKKREGAREGFGDEHGVGTKDVSLHNAGWW